MAINGQLGLGDIFTRGDGANEMGVNLPAVNLGTGRSAIKVAAGDYHTCAILDNGSVKCWGENLFGQLGLGDTATRGNAANQMGDNLPVVPLGTGRTAVQIVATGSVTCARLDNGASKCWGRNAEGQAGQGDSSIRGDNPNEMGDSLAPIDLGSGQSTSVLATGGGANCALLNSAAVKCWGWNAYGMLGLGDTANRGDNANEMGNNLPFVDLGNGRTVVKIASGNFHSCALLDNGSVKCWGWSYNGQIGLGNTNIYGAAPNEMGANLPALDFGTGRTVTDISAGGYQSCAWLDNGALKCWGYNGFGALGIGDQVHRGDNANEMGDNLPAVNLGTGRSASKIAMHWHACAILDNGSLKCWGDNRSGQLGLGDLSNRGDGANEMGDNLPIIDLGP